MLFLCPLGMSSKTKGCLQGIVEPLPHTTYIIGKKNGFRFDSQLTRK